MDTTELAKFIQQLDTENINLHMHTVGDRATRSVLDAVESVRNELERPLQIHVTLCHLELIADDDFRRFRELDIFATLAHIGTVAGLMARNIRSARSGLT